MRRASLPPRPSFLPSRDDVSLRFGSARGRLPAPRRVRTAAAGDLAWGLCALANDRAALVAWRPRDAALAWRVELPGDARFAVSPDGALLLLCDDRGGRSLLDARTGATLSEARDGRGLPDALALARADARRALVVRGATATVVDLDTGAVVASLRGAAPAALSPDGARVALVTPRAVVVHHLRDGSTARHPLARGDAVSAVDLADALAVGFNDGRALTAAPRGLARVVPAATRHAVTAVRAGRDGAVAIGHADGLLRLVAGGGDARETSGDGPVDDITPTLDRALFREARAAPMADLDARERHDARAGHLDAVTAAAVSRDGRRVVTASRDRTLRVWDADSREALLTLEGHAGPVAALALSRDGRRALSGGALDGLRAWCLASGDELPLPGASGVRATRLVLSPCGERVVAFHGGREALLLDARTGTLVGRAPIGPWGDVAAFDARGEGLFVPRAATPDGVLVARLDAATGRALGDVLLPAPPRDARRARGCAVVRDVDGGLLTAETDRAGVTRWALGAAPEALRHPAGADLLRAAMVAAGERLLVAASGARVDVCDLTDGARATLRLPERHDAVTSLALDPGGRWVVAGTAQGLAQRFAV